MTPGRNDPCPCGSGVKYKRCCLDRERGLLRLIDELERLVGAIGEWAEARSPESYDAACREFFGCGQEELGLFGLDPEERLELDLWLVCDRGLGGQATPLELALKRPAASPPRSPAWPPRASGPGASMPSGTPA